jgi:hypothetical protein
MSIRFVPRWARTWDDRPLILLSFRRKTRVRPLSWLKRSLNDGFGRSEVYLGKDAPSNVWKIRRMLRAPTETILPLPEPERHINIGRRVLPHPIRRFCGTRAFRIFLPEDFSRTLLAFGILIAISLPKTCFSRRLTKEATRGTCTGKNLALQTTSLAHHWHVTSTFCFCGSYAGWGQV